MFFVIFKCHSNFFPSALNFELPRITLAFMGTFLNVYFVRYCNKFHIVIKFMYIIYIYIYFYTPTNIMFPLLWVKATHCVNRLFSIITEMAYTQKIITIFADNNHCAINVRVNVYGSVSCNVMEISFRCTRFFKIFQNTSKTRTETSAAYPVNALYIHPANGNVCSSAAASLRRRTRAEKSVN